jgi:hypothetical protein
LEKPQEKEINIYMMNQKNQKRIRSLCYLLQYSGLTDVTLVKNELFRLFGIGEQINCKYVFAVEKNASKEILTLIGLNKKS